MKAYSWLFVLLAGSASLLTLTTAIADAAGLPNCYSLPPPPPDEGAPFTFVDFPRPAELGPPAIQLKPISTCRAGYFNTKGSEITAYDPRTKRLFVVNQAQDAPPDVPPTLDVIDIHNPGEPEPLFSIDLSGIFFDGDGNPLSTLPTSVAVNKGIVAVAVHPEPSTAPGQVRFYDAGLIAETKLIKPIPLNVVGVGFTPDMLIFTPNGQTVLVANTGSPPTTGGSVSLIDIRRGVGQATVTHADFSAFNGSEDLLRSDGVRIYPGWTAAQSLLPEYIAVSNNSSTAWISLEINNALAVLDIKRGRVTAVVGLDVKDHSRANNGYVAWDERAEGGSNRLDASDEDCPVEGTCENPVANKKGKINIANWPVSGMYQPDAIEAYHTLGQTYLVTANEGTWFNEEEGVADERVRVRTLTLDDTFPADLKQRSKLGNLRVSNLQGDENPKDGKYEKLYAFSARSFSIWSEQGKLVFDSGDDFEQITAQTMWFESPDHGRLSYFNTDDSASEFDTKSDDQGPQPDGITVGKLYGRYYVFVALVRPGGIMVYDITDPQYPRFQQYVNNRNLGINPAACPKGSPESGPCAQVGDLGPEGVLFISEADSPTKEPLLVVANQTSSSTTLYRIKRTLPPPR